MCQFVLLVKIEEVQTDHPARFGRNSRLIRVAYELARVDSGADYAMGLLEEKFFRFGGVPPPSPGKNEWSRRWQRIWAWKGSIPVAREPSVSPERRRLQLSRRRPRIRLTPQKTKQATADTETTSIAPASSGKSAKRFCVLYLDLGGYSARGGIGGRLRVRCSVAAANAQLHLRRNDAAIPGGQPLSDGHHQWYVAIRRWTGVFQRSQNQREKKLLQQWSISCRACGLAVNSAEI